MSLLTEEEARELFCNITIQRYKKNEIIYKEGDVPTDLLCLITGKVKVYKEGISGRTQIIRVIKPVEYFGYRAYFANQNFITSAAAFETTYICKIPLEYINNKFKIGGISMYYRLNNNFAFRGWVGLPYAIKNIEISKSGTTGETHLTKVTYTLDSSVKLPYNTQVFSALQTYVSEESGVIGAEIFSVSSTNSYITQIHIKYLSKASCIDEAYPYLTHNLAKSGLPKL
mgnify:CR=1 FL=1